MPPAGFQAPDPLALDGLASAWERNRSIRNRVMQSGSLLQWPDSKKVGVISFETMSYNYKVLLRLLRIWLPDLEKLKTINVYAARREVQVDAGCVLVSSWCV